MLKFISTQLKRKLLFGDKEMNDLEYKHKVDFLWNSEIILEELKEKKKITRKEIFKIENKLRKLSYEIWLNSPKIKNDPISKANVGLVCIQDFINHNRPK